MPCGPKTAMRNLASVDETLKHPHEIISVAAVAALRAITRAYFAQGMYIIYSILYLASI